MEDKRANEAIKNIDLDKLYSGRKFESLIMTTRYICCFSMFINILFGCYRIFLIVKESLSGNASVTDYMLFAVIMLIHIMIVYYGYKSLVILKYKS